MLDGETWRTLSRVKESFLQMKLANFFAGEPYEMQHVPDLLEHLRTAPEIFHPLWTISSTMTGIVLLISIKHFISIAMAGRKIRRVNQSVFMPLLANVYIKIFLFFPLMSILSWSALFAIRFTLMFQLMLHLYEVGCLIWFWELMVDFLNGPDTTCLLVHTVSSLTLEKVEKVLPVYLKTPTGATMSLQNEAESICESSSPDFTTLNRSVFVASEKGEIHVPIVESPRTLDWNFKSTNSKMGPLNSSPVELRDVASCRRVSNGDVNRFDIRKGKAITDLRRMTDIGDFPNVRRRMSSVLSSGQATFPKTIVDHENVDDDALLDQIRHIHFGPFLVLAAFPFCWFPGFRQRREFRQFDLRFSYYLVAQYGVFAILGIFSKAISQGLVLVFQYLSIGSLLLCMYGLLILFRATSRVIPRTETRLGWKFGAIKIVVFIIKMSEVLFRYFSPYFIKSRPPPYADAVMAHAWLSFLMNMASFPATLLAVLAYPAAEVTHRHSESRTARINQLLCLLTDILVRTPSETSVDQLFERSTLANDNSVVD